METILITGCAGFIGSHTAELLLKNGFNVLGIDNFDSFYSKSLKQKNLSYLFNQNNFSFIEIDITNKNNFHQLPHNIDYVVHLAAKAGVRPSISNPNEYINTNIIGTHHILDWMKVSGIKKMIFASSSSVYGNNAKVPFSESDNVDYPISPYAFTKKAGELLNHTFHHLYNVDILNLRLFTVYGPRQRPDLAIRKFVELIKHDQPVTIYGDGLTGRDYTYVEDITHGIYNGLIYLRNNNNVFETINLGNSSPVLLSDLVTLIYQLLKKEKNITFLPMQEGDVNLTYADIQKAKKLLNYHPAINLEEGLKRFINWYDTTI